MRESWKANEKRVAMPFVVDEYRMQCCFKSVKSLKDVWQRYGKETGLDASRRASAANSVLGILSGGRLSQDVGRIAVVGLRLRETSDNSVRHNKARFQVKKRVLRCWLSTFLHRCGCF